MCLSAEGSSELEQTFLLYLRTFLLNFLHVNFEWGTGGLLSSVAGCGLCINGIGLWSVPEKFRWNSANCFEGARKPRHHITWALRFLLGRYNTAENAILSPGCYYNILCALISKILDISFQKQKSNSVDVSILYSSALSRFATDLEFSV